MNTVKHSHCILIALIAIVFFTITSIASADHEATVAGEVVSSSDPNIGSGPNCAGLHYQGTLNGKPDPDPEGCGHGIIKILEHDDDDKSIVPETKTKEKDNGPSIWKKIGGWLGDAFDVVAQAFGAPPPKTISDSVDIVVESSKGIKENIDTIEEYRNSVDEDEDTLNIYNSSAEGLEKGSLSQKFFNWVYGK